MFAYVPDRRPGTSRYSEEEWEALRRFGRGGPAEETGPSWTAVVMVIASAAAFVAGVLLGGGA